MDGASSKRRIFSALKYEKAGASTRNPGPSHLLYRRNASPLWSKILHLE
jgi:hypothetical protein